jgi:hypothetical protein
MKKQKHTKRLLILLIILSATVQAQTQIKQQPLQVVKTQKTISLSQKDSIILFINGILNSFAGHSNDCETWAAMQGKIWNLLAIKWHSGVLHGSKPEEAFFCADRKANDDPK